MHGATIKKKYQNKRYNVNQKDEGT